MLIIFHWLVRTTPTLFLICSDHLVGKWSFTAHLFICSSTPKYIMTGFKTLEIGLLASLLLAESMHMRNRKQSGIEFLNIISIIATMLWTELYNHPPPKKKHQQWRNYIHFINIKGVQNLHKKEKYLQYLRTIPFCWPHDCRMTIV